MTNSINLSSSELSGLWGTFLNDSMAMCMLKHFSIHVNDDEIKHIIDYSVSLSKTHIEKIPFFLKKEGYPVPMGFCIDRDVDVSAPRLYTDSFFIVYIYSMARIGMHQYSLLLANAAREDIREFFSECYSSSMNLFNKSIEVLLSKGLFRRSPYIPPNLENDTIGKKGYFSGWFEERRPMNSFEITEIYYNIQRNALAHMLLIGFSQVAQDKKVGQFMVKGRDIATKHIELLNSLISEEELMSSLTWTIDATTSTSPTFSDKLMMNHVAVLTTLGVGYYGIGLGTAMRRDIGTHYMRLIGEAIKYAGDGTDIMVENRWLEEPPHIVDRDDLANT